jgi:hypothetical protein
MSWDNYIVEVDLDGQWLAITSSVDTEQSQISIQTERRTESDEAQPSTATLVLNNTDHQFTVGNLSSPLSPHWKQGVRIRIAEVLGFRRFPLITGRVEVPEIDDWAEQGVDQFVTVTVIDKLTELDGSRKFISNLAEHIIWAGGSSLVGFYPLNETGTSRVFRDQVGGLPPLQLLANDSSLADEVVASALAQPGQGVNAPADDTKGVLFGPVTTQFGNIQALARGHILTMKIPTSAGLQMASGVPLTLICWVNLDTLYEDTQQIFFVNLSNVAGGTITQIDVKRHTMQDTDPAAGYWTGDVFSIPSGLDGTVTGPWDVGSLLMPVGVQLTFSTNSMRFWVGDTEYTTTPTGTITSPQLLTGNFTLGSVAGALSYVQIYIGTYTRAQFLAQLEVGRSGLGGQYTGERIRTIAGYAGVPASELGGVEQGTSRMVGTSLAGQTALPQMRLAEATEQGRLRADGNGLLRFNSRITRYNV